MAGISRRKFLTAAAGGAAVMAVDPLALIRPAVAEAAEAGFAQGVASGQATCEGITLWARVDGLEQSSRLRLEVARDPGFSKVVFSDRVTARARQNFTVHSRLAGLKPGEQYYYRFFTRRSDSPVGRFRTSLPADSCEPVRIGFFSCQDYEVGFYTAHAALADEDLDMVVCLGDYIYERSFTDDPVRNDPTGEDGVSEVETLAGYRDKYALYNSDPNLRRMRQSHALMAIWDDHEVEDNYAAGRPGEATEQRDLAFRRRRRNGYRAFFEHMPRIRNGTEADRIYGSLRLGGNAELFLLDQRQYRSDQPCGDQIGFANCPGAFDRDRTLLGAAQERWLKRGLTDSTATWKVVGNQVMIMALDAPATNPVNPDQWDGYKAEREELIDFIAREGIEDVSFITGDIHTFFAGQVTPSGRQPSQPQPGPPAATEFVGGSITSEGVPEAIGVDPVSTELVALLDEPTIRLNNPHIEFVDTDFKGYGVLEARKEELRVDYRAVRSIARPRSPAFTLQRFRVQSGRPNVEVLGGGSP